MRSSSVILPVVTASKGKDCSRDCPHFQFVTGAMMGAYCELLTAHYHSEIAWMRVQPVGGERLFRFVRHPFCVSRQSEEGRVRLPICTSDDGHHCSSDCPGFAFGLSARRTEVHSGALCNWFSRFETPIWLEEKNGENGAGGIVRCPACIEHEEKKQ